MTNPTREEKEYQEWKEMKTKADQKTKQVIAAKQVVESIIEHIRWEKYRYPRDENERGYNRWIDWAIEMIESEFIY